MMKNGYDDNIQLHKNCGGVLTKIWTGQNETQIRCQYCKKALSDEELVSHGFKKKSELKRKSDETDILS
jgi:hypothetical protein